MSGDELPFTIIYQEGYGDGTNTINNIKKIYSKCKRGVILGKGPTFQEVDKDPDQFITCINETINFCNHADLLVCNDVEAFSLLDYEHLKKINLKNILLPYHPHLQQACNRSVTYKKIFSKIKNYFSGNLIVYNLHTANINYKEHITLKYAANGAHTALEFMAIFLDIKEYDVYGIMKGRGYHPNFVDHGRKSNCHSDNYSHYDQLFNKICSDYKATRTKH